jgi:putative membrane protein
MGLFLLIGLGVLIYLFVINKDRLGFRDGLTRETPLEILKKRYARGEITREQFEKMKEDLKA